MDRQTQSIALEKQHVHDVYHRIAPHFSDTRYKAWPRVKEFLLGLEPGSIVADVGCGNGKYLGINKQIYKVGSDCCPSLVDIAHSASHEAMVCDNIRLPYRDNSFDAVISIAVIHHFATTERRAQALKELARICRPGGQIMIYVWAMEQKLRKFDAQDVLVPWHLQPRSHKKTEESNFLQHHFVKNESPIKENTRRKPSQKSRSYSVASGQSVGHPNHVRVPYIPSKHSGDLARRNGKPTGRHIQELHRTHSDQGFDPLAYAEKNHFKRLLLPTRSDSVDDVFLNISTEEDRITCQEVHMNRTESPRPERSGASPKKRGLQKMFSFDERLLRDDAPEESSLIDSLTSTATQLLRAISRQHSFEIEKRPADKEVKGKGVEMATFRRTLVRQESDSSVPYGHRTNNIASMNGSDKGLKNEIKQGKGRSSNCAIDTGTFTKSRSNSDTAPLLNGYKTNAQNKTGDAEQARPSFCDIKAYNSRGTIQLKPLSSSQPIVGINSLTAQGEVYRKSCSLHGSPHAGASRERDSSVDSVSSSDDSLTAFPVEMANSEKGFAISCTSRANQNTTPDLPDPPSTKPSEPIKSNCNSSEGNESKEDDHRPNSSGDQDFNSSGGADNLPMQDTDNQPAPDSPDSHHERKDTEESSAPMCQSATETKSASTAQLNGNGLDQNLVLDDGTNGTTPDSSHPDDSPLSKSPKVASHEGEDPSLYLRYYHVFREGELIDLIEDHVDGLHILRSYYDHANWCVIAEKVQVWTI